MILAGREPETDGEIERGRRSGSPNDSEGRRSARKMRKM